METLKNQTKFAGIDPDKGDPKGDEKTEIPNADLPKPSGTFGKGQSKSISDNGIDSGHLELVQTNAGVPKLSDESSR